MSTANFLLMVKQRCHQQFDGMQSAVTDYEIFHSATDIYRPLDMRFFGAMKSSGSKEFGEFVYFN